ncbi:MAG: YqaJ viral recombinase family protein [Ramlibacter sp.]|nr:YqaJ viral recombinase family protein [Ramlibacter sp.]
MKIFKCVQGSEEWHGLRAGVCTASMFRVARSRVGTLTPQQQAYVDAIRAGKSEAQATEAATYKSKVRPTDNMLRAIEGLPVGDFSDPAKNYAFRLAVERISGEPLLDDKFENYAMRRGHELEPAARQEHEIFAGITVERTGFVTTDDELFGSSVDGLIRPNGASEYKCLVSPEGLREVLMAGDISDFMDQMQGGLWITGLDYFHFGLYCPALAPIKRQFTMHVVERDDDYIGELEKDLMAFNRLVEDFEAKLRGGAANHSVLQQAA